MTSPRRTTRRRPPLGAPVVKRLIRGRAALPGWVFRSLSVTRCRLRAAALTRVIPDLRPQYDHFDLRYDV